MCYDLVFLEEGCLLLPNFVKVARSVFYWNNFWILMTLLYYVASKHPISNRRKVFLIHCLLELVYLRNDSHAICTETCLLHIRLVNMHMIVAFCMCIGSAFASLMHGCSVHIFFCWHTVTPCCGAVSERINIQWLRRVLKFKIISAYGVNSV